MLNPIQKSCLVPRYSSNFWLCRKALKVSVSDHAIGNCNKFKSAEEKFNFIKQCKGCTRCGLLNHVRENCRYKFSGKCYKCKSFHAHFLCFNNSKAKPKGNNNSKDTEKTTAGISANVENFSVMNACENSNNIIPTFTANFESQPIVSVRCMYDTAAQTSFINENAFKKLSCKVIKSKISEKYSRIQ